MKTEIQTVQDYFDSIAEEQKPAMKQLSDTISESLPEGFEFGISYGMPSWMVPLGVYPSGYHCKPGTPLPFISVASQKNFIALYHMGLYANPALYDWFISEYPKYSSKKLDMGKSCIRFKKPEDIPYELIAELSKKMTPEDWVKLYEDKFRKKG